MDEILKIITEDIPPDWWRVLAFVFAAALLFLLGKGVNVFISFAKKWFEKQEKDHQEMREDIEQVREDFVQVRNDLKDLVAVNKMHEWRLTTAEADIIKLQDYKVKYGNK